MTRPSLFIVMSVVILLGHHQLGSSSLFAQTSTPENALSVSHSDSSSQNSAHHHVNKLEQTEATYQINLRKIHAPILQDYLNKLETLNNQFKAQSRTEQAVQVQKEITKIREIIATTGILPLMPTNQDNQTESPSSPPVTPSTIALNASEATSNTNKQPSLPLGSISWNLSSIPGGLYDVRLIYDATSLPKDEMITLNIGPHQLNATIRSDQITGNTQSVHIANIGQILITGNLSNTTATIHNTTPLTPYLQLRNVVLVPVPAKAR